MAAVTRLSSPGEAIPSRPAAQRVRAALRLAGLIAAALGAGFAIGGSARSGAEQASPARMANTAIQPPAPKVSAPPTKPTETRPSSDSAVTHQLVSLNEHMSALATKVARLQDKVSSLERDREIAAPRYGASRHIDANDDPDVLPLNMPEMKRDTLVRSGVPMAHASDIVHYQSELELNRLKLRDRATREGWIDSDTYRASLGELESSELDLRREIGEPAYDRYLFNVGAPNRIQVTAIVQGSAAERYELRSGDVIEAYAGQRIFNLGDLHAATASGERDEAVSIHLRRGDTVMEGWIPRGPIGVRVTSIRQNPFH